jgi:hypothetical protein
VIVYAATKHQFLQDSDNDNIEEVTLQHFKLATGKKGGGDQTWQGALTYMAKMLRDEG